MSRRIITGAACLALLLASHQVDATNWRATQDFRIDGGAGVFRDGNTPFKPTTSVLKRITSRPQKAEIGVGDVHLIGLRSAATFDEDESLFNGETKGPGHILDLIHEPPQYPHPPISHRFGSHRIKTGTFHEDELFYDNKLKHYQRPFYPGYEGVGQILNVPTSVNYPPPPIKNHGSRHIKIDAFDEDEWFGFVDDDAPLTKSPSHILGAFDNPRREFRRPPISSRFIHSDAVTFDEDEEIELQRHQPSSQSSTSKSSPRASRGAIVPDKQVLNNQSQSTIIRNNNVRASIDPRMMQSITEEEELFDSLQSKPSMSSLAPLPTYTDSSSLFDEDDEQENSGKPSTRRKHTKHQVKLTVPSHFQVIAHEKDDDEFIQQKIYKPKFILPKHNYHNDNDNEYNTKTKFLNIVSTMNEHESEGNNPHRKRLLRGTRLYDEDNDEMLSAHQFYQPSRTAIQFEEDEVQSIYQPMAAFVPPESIKPIQKTTTTQTFDEDEYIGYISHPKVVDPTTLRPTANSNQLLDEDELYIDFIKIVDPSTLQPCNNTRLPSIILLEEDSESWSTPKKHAPFQRLVKSNLIKPIKFNTNEEYDF